MKYDLGFGNTVCVRQAFLETIRNDMIVFTHDSLSKFDYPDRYGDPELIKITREVIKRQTGIYKKYVFLTNGATGAVTIGLRAFRQRGKTICYTRKAPWYLRYPSMIAAADLIHLNETHGVDPTEGVVLLDVPSNPEGSIRGIDNSITAPMILDSVYLNNVYLSAAHRKFLPIYSHEILAGSYSKLLGMNGLRIGWIATNDFLLAERIRDLIVGEYCGLSVASTEILKNVLFNFDWDSFEKSAQMKLDYNREQWSRLERYFGQTPVQDSGMFYYGPTDETCRKMLAKSGIKYTSGLDLGTDDNFGRFNLGQDCRTIGDAVRAMLSEDLAPKRKSTR